MKSSTGFTIIELVISIFILSIAVVGIFNAFSVMTILTSASADQLTATYLVQEGLEIVRNIRDGNWLDMDICSANPLAGICPANWDKGLTSVGLCADASTGCEADYTSTSMLGTSGNYLYLSPDGFYGYDATNASPTKFQRKIIITKVADVNNQADDHILKVTVMVAWNEKATVLHSGRDVQYGMDNCEATDNCIKAEVMLYDWYNYLSYAQ